MFRTAVIVALASLASATAGRAQEQSHTLADGRVVTAPAAATDICALRLEHDDDRYAYFASFQCRDVDAPIAGNGFFGIGRQHGETSPREYLHQVTGVFWPDETFEQRDARIRAATLEFGGGKHQFLCLGGEDPSTGIAEASCVLDQPRTQLIVSAESDTVEHAYVVMLMFLTRTAIR